MISKQELKQAREQINAALEIVVENNPKLESLRLGNITYDENGFSSKIEAIFTGGKTKEAVNYERSYRYLGLPVLGTKFKAWGTTNTVTGLSPRSTHVLFTNEEGEKRKAKVEAVKHFCQMETRLFNNE